jgi:BMFP domain-containing protein YqiC
MNDFETMPIGTKERLTELEERVRELESEIHRLGLDSEDMKDE